MISLPRLAAAKAHPANENVRDRLGIAGDVGAQNLDVDSVCLELLNFVGLLFNGGHLNLVGDGCDVGVRHLLGDLVLFSNEVGDSVVVYII